MPNIAILLLFKNSSYPYPFVNIYLLSFVEVTTNMEL